MKPASFISDNLKNAGFTQAPLSGDKKSGAGFTFLEVLVAIFLITVGVGGTYALISQTISAVTLSSQNLTAAYLAQEGIEIIRNIRDNNLLEQRDYHTGIWGCMPRCEVDYKSLAVVLLVNRYLNIDADGFYSYSPGTPTKFKRKIMVPKVDPLEVLVQVEWEERGRTHQITVRENLYDWR